MACAALGACGARTGLESEEGRRILPLDALELDEAPPSLVPPPATSGTAPAMPPSVVIPPVASSSAPLSSSPVPTSDDVTTGPQLAEGECEAGDVLIYLVTSDFQLYVYDPDVPSLSLRGALACDSGAATPYSMAVNRFGVAYVLYNDGYLYRVDTRDLGCEKTPFVPGVETFKLFGMGFVRNLELAIDELFVTDIGAEASAGLARIDVESWVLQLVGEYAQTIGQMEMTGSNDGQLYGYAADLDTGGRILHIDKTNAALLEETPLSVGAFASSLAFAYFQSRYYMFTGDGMTTRVHRYDAATTTLEELGAIEQIVVGAGVSTCDSM